MKAEVDEDLCVASAMCEQLCPEVFEVGGDTAVVTVETVPSEAEDACREAAESCPSAAITVTE